MGIRLSITNGMCTTGKNCNSNTSQRTCACKLHPSLCETHVPHFSLSAQSGPSAPEFPRNLRAQALINPIIARTPQNDFLKVERSPATHFWSLLGVLRLHGRSSQVWDPKFHTAHFMSARPTRVKTLRQPIAFLLQQENTFEHTKAWTPLTVVVLCAVQAQRTCTDGQSLISTSLRPPRCCR